MCVKIQARTFVGGKMNRDKTIELARRSGITIDIYDIDVMSQVDVEHLQRFADYVRAQTIQECASRAEAYAYMSENFNVLAAELRGMIDKGDLSQSEREAWRYADELEQERKRLTKENEGLRKALAQFIDIANMSQERGQEPVAWLQTIFGPGGHVYYRLVHDSEMKDTDKSNYAPLYAAPPKREWVGLTDEEFEQVVDGLEDLRDCWIQIEAKLKEKNCG
jgi:hypothetical protein